MPRETTPAPCAGVPLQEYAHEKTPLKNKRGYTNKQEKHCPVKIRQRCVKVPQTFSKKNLELVISYIIFVPALVFS